MGGDAGQGARGDHDDASQCQWREVCVLSRAHTKNVVSSVNAVLVNRNVRKNKSLTLTVNNSQLSAGRVVRTASPVSELLTRGSNVYNVASVSADNRRSGSSVRRLLPRAPVWNLEERSSHK